MDKNEILEKIIQRAAPIWGVAPESLNADTTFASMNAKSAHYSMITTTLEDDLEIPYLKFRRCETLGAAAEYVASLEEE